MAFLFSVCYGESNTPINQKLRDESSKRRSTCYYSKELELSSKSIHTLEKNASTSNNPVMASLYSLFGSSMLDSCDDEDEEEEEEEEDDVYNPNKLSFYLSPPLFRRVDRMENLLFFEDSLMLLAISKSSISGNKRVGLDDISSSTEGNDYNNDYGLFVDLQDSFDPRLYLRQDLVDANEYALPPGQEVSKIIIRTHRLNMKMKNKNKKTRRWTLS